MKRVVFAVVVLLALPLLAIPVLTAASTGNSSSPPACASNQACPPIPQLLPGEDRSFGSGLFVDLVPSTCWFTNARSCLSQQDWDRLRRMVVDRAGQRCEICSATKDHATKRWLEVHERWAYDETTNIQTLRRLICLCTPCHTVTHFGLALLRGVDGQARAHLTAVTGLGEVQADQHIRDAFAEWQHRSCHAWVLDLSLLTGAGLTPIPPPTAEQRASSARKTGSA